MKGEAQERNTGVLSSEITKVGGGACEYAKLVVVDISEGVEKIDDSAFYDSTTAVV